MTHLHLTRTGKLAIIAALLAIVALLAYQIGSAAPLDVPAAKTCAPTSWQQRATVYGVHCAAGWCTGRVSTCGTWGCAYGGISGPRASVYTGNAVSARITRNTACRYSLQVRR